MNNLRVVVIVSQDYSDIYFANQLIKYVNVVGVIVEKQYEAPVFSEKLVKAVRLGLNPRKLFKKIAENKVINFYNKKSGEVDVEHFGVERFKLFPPKKCTVIYTEGIRQINHPGYVEQIKQLKPDVIALCGASIVKEPIITLPPQGVLNLHGGLPQKYRGVWTTLWAVYNKEPEYIGATVHFVDSGVDTGRIIYQGRPEIIVEDNPETLYIKVVKLGIKMMVQAINDIANTTLTSYEQKKTGRLYLNKTVNAKVIEQAWINIEKGIICKYLENKTDRDKKVLKLMVGEFFCASL